MKKVSLVLIALIILAGCSNDENPYVSFRQYADKVLGFSSEYGSSTTDPPEDWSAWQALYKENVYDLTPPDNYGDIEQAWTHESTSGDRHYLTLGYDTAQTVSKIEIYETYNPGAIDTVYLRDASTKKWNKVYSEPSEYMLDENGDGVSRIFTINLTETKYMVDGIRVAIDGSLYYDWVEIDAIALSGRRKK